MWFTDIAASRNPGPKELSVFVSNIESFLSFVLENRKEFAFLWEDEENLLYDARETYINDVRKATVELQFAILNIEESSLLSHGLIGRPLRFKLRVVNSIALRWNDLRGQFGIRGWLKQLFDAIDAILDSLIDAAGGAGGLIKEFKDALSALVKTS
jgi:hypothetical protein